MGGGKACGSVQGLKEARFGYHAMISGFLLHYYCGFRCTGQSILWEETLVMFISGNKCLGVLEILGKGILEQRQISISGGRIRTATSGHLPHIVPEQGPALGTVLMIDDR